MKLINYLTFLRMLNLLITYNNKAGYLQALYKEPHKFVENSFTSSDLLKITNEYSKQNYLSQTSDRKPLERFIFGEYKKRGNTVSKFNLKNVDCNKINEILYNYDKDYWKYINHYEGYEVPDFTKTTKEIKTNDLDA